MALATTTASASASERVERGDPQADEVRRRRYVRGVAGAARGVVADPARRQEGAQVGGEVAGGAVVGADQQRRPAGQPAVVLEQRGQQQRPQHRRGAHARPPPPPRRRRARARRARASARSRRRCREAVGATAKRPARRARRSTILASRATGHVRRRAGRAGALPLDLAAALGGGALDDAVVLVEHPLQAGDAVRVVGGDALGQLERRVLGRRGRGDLVDEAPAEGVVGADLCGR